MTLCHGGSLKMLGKSSNLTKAIITSEARGAGPVALGDRMYNKER